MKLEGVLVGWDGLLIDRGTDRWMDDAGIWIEVSSGVAIYIQASSTLRLAARPAQKETSREETLTTNKPCNIPNGLSSSYLSALRDPHASIIRLEIRADSRERLEFLPRKRMIKRSSSRERD